MIGTNSILYSALLILSSLIVVQGEEQQQCLVQETGESECTDTTNSKSKTANTTTTGTTSGKDITSWNELLLSNEPIVANGNVFPIPSNEDKEGCLILTSHSRILLHCPLDDDGEFHILHKHDRRRFRGIFAANAPEDVDRLWLLTSPSGIELDLFEELDLDSGKIVQTLRIPGTIDAHDVVRYKNSVFVADTRHGRIIELEIPKSAPNDGKSYAIDDKYIMNPDTHHQLPMATVKHVHEGFTRADHVNNVAIHENYILAGLHGGGYSPDTYKPTRLAVLPRDLSAKEIKTPGFDAIDTVGNFCHGIAFYKDEKDNNTIKLISLDSASGSLVSIVLSGKGSKQRKREVLWEPDLTHPALALPDDLPKGYKGSLVFSKGLAVQGGIAYFGVSGARRPKDRMIINPTLLVAVDLATKKEVFVRTVHSHGLVNQVVSESYLGFYELQQGNNVIEEEEEIITEEERSRITTAMAMNEFPNLTEIDFTLPEGVSDVCYDRKGKTKRLPLKYKEPKNIQYLYHNSDPDKIAKYICTLDVSVVTQRIMSTKNETFDKDIQDKTNARFGKRKENLDAIKPGVDDAIFVFSNRIATEVFHFPWLEDWLPMLKEKILDPLKIDVNSIARMQFALMKEGSTINKHSDQGNWAQNTHRTHVPLYTHGDIYFVAENPANHYLRIPSKVGSVFEFNNRVTHAVRNYGGDRIHLIIDWLDKPAKKIIKLQPGQVCDYNGDAGVLCETVEEQAVREAEVKAKQVEAQRRQMRANIHKEFPNLSEIEFNVPDDDDDDTCLNKKGKTKQIPLKYKEPQAIQYLYNNNDPDKVAKYICTLDISDVTTRVVNTLWNETFNKEYQEKTNARFSNRQNVMDQFKPGVAAAIFIFSDRFGTDVYHFPWLDTWLPMLKEKILDPLNIDVNNIARMQMALMKEGSTINKHSDSGMWTANTHRTHVPIISHDDIYFIAENPANHHVRIPSKVGVVFEFNNRVTHAVRNLGGDRVHLIIDWLDQPPKHITKLKPEQVCAYNGDAGVLCSD